MNHNKEQKGTAIYSLPDSNIFHEVSGRVSQIGTQDILQEPGFIFAPYDHTEFPILRISGKPVVTDLAKHDFQVSADAPYPVEAVTQESYQNMFEESIRRIEEGTTGKIVLSIRQMDSNFLPAMPDFLQQLRKAYPHAFIYLFYTQDGEFWIGASPELLLETQYPFQRTMALAGTLKNAPDIGDWPDKEREEHHYVEKFFEKMLEGRPYRKEGPNPVEAGPVYHLKTTYYLHIESLPVNPVDLHPSPALSGYPVPDAMQHIHHLEPHSRRYYTGFLGPVWDEGHSRFFINLRCLEVFRDKVALYAGGGITIHSDSDAEWQEIQHKLSTLRSRFHKGENV